jgi:3-oxoacyl-[acyl-carrier protein] reductase
MKTVIVTGAARGLGLAISRRLQNEGYNIVGVGRTVTTEFEDLAAGGQSSFIQYDLANIDGIGQLAKAIRKEHGDIYGLVNNAGIGLDGVLGTMHVSEISKVISVNLISAIILTKYVSRHMLALDEGRIVNISSIIASTGFNGLAVYAASKAGLEGFTRSLSRELGRAKITVNCVAPGYMETQMTAGLEGEKFDSVRRRAPLGLPTTEDAAAAVSYLLSNDASRVTGTVLTVDGGSTA